MALHIYRLALIALFITMGIIVATTPAHSMINKVEEVTPYLCKYMHPETEKSDFLVLL